MFDDVFGMAILCAENFREAAHDSFGLSISTEVLEPILKEIDSLRIFNEEFQRQALNLDKTLESARLIQITNPGNEK